MMSRARCADGHLRFWRACVARQNQARLFGVLGDPVDHSLSPAMHNAAFAAAGLPHVYLRYRVPAALLPDAVREAKALRMGGLNLTVPLKEIVLPLLDALTHEAERIGAVNTVLFPPGGRTVGDNTDGHGFLAALRGRVRLSGARALVIGAGGSARAVGAALCQVGAARITIANRTPVRAERLAERLGRLGAGATAAVPLAALERGQGLEDATLVVNTTPLGLAGSGPRVRYAAAPRGCLFVDLVYGVRPTPFLAGAARAGRPTLGGAHMLLHQGALAFVAEEKPLSYLEREYRLPVVDPLSLDIPREVLGIVPQALVTKHHLVPTSLVRSTLTLAMADPSNLTAINEVKFLTGYDVKVAVAAPTVIQHAIERYYDRDTDYDAVLSQLGNDSLELLHDEAEIDLKELERATEEAPVVRLVNALLSDAIRKRASDVHVEPYEKMLRVRFRIDGVLYEIMQPPLELKKVSTNISTAEDPIEFNLVGINQVQMHDEIGLNFAAALRAFLRQDPDVIMVGEIRDFETAEIGVKAALTGHLVLSTLHTNDAPSTVNRLLNMGVEPFLVASSINLIMAQRLARVICAQCKEEHPVAPEVLRELGWTGEPFMAYHGAGCTACGGTTYRGRIALYEVMPMGDELREQVLAGATALDLKRAAVAAGMKSLRQSGLSKVAEGMTTIEEILRVTMAD